MPPLTSEQQKAALGNVHRKPMQGDLLTGEFAVKPPKNGRGGHVLLHRTPTEPTVAVGMAHFPGTGPKGKYCHECGHFGDLTTKRGKFVGTEKDACAKAREITGQTQRGGIGANRACKYFKKQTQSR